MEEQIQQFLDTIQQDEDLLRSFNAALTEAEAMAVLESYGFSFSLPDYNILREKVRETK